MTPRNLSIIKAVARQCGLEIHPYGNAVNFLVIGTGAGITMAVCDMLDMSQGALVDLGAVGISKRVQFLDYATTFSPCLLSLWCGAYPATAYPEFLKERGNSPRNSVAYINGLAATEGLAGMSELGYATFSCLKNAVAEFAIKINRLQDAINL